MSRQPDALLTRSAGFSHNYLFLIKDKLVIAQPLDAPETGELLVSLLRQGFVIGPVTIQAATSRQALENYDQHAQLQVLTSRLRQSAAQQPSQLQSAQVNI